MNHEFWTIVPSSYSYHFLKLESVTDSQGLDKVLEVYVERSKILWKSNNVMLWVKGALGFVLNRID
jgi:lantibiotic modifying enzyme